MIAVGKLSNLPLDVQREVEVDLLSCAAALALLGLQEAPQPLNLSHLKSPVQTATQTLLTLTCVYFSFRVSASFTSLIFYVPEP